MVVATTSGVSGVISANGNIDNRFAGEGGTVFIAKVGLGTNKAFTDQHPSLRFLFIAILIGLLAVRRLRMRTISRGDDRSQQ